MKPFQRYLMKSIRTIMQYNLYSERQSISLAPCRDQQVPYLKVPGITKYTLRFIYERSKPQTKDRLIQPRLAGRLLCSKHYIFYLHWLKQGSTKSKKKKKKVKKARIVMRFLGYRPDIQRLDTLCCFLIFVIK